MSQATANTLFYTNNGRTTVVWFDADQMRARILQFSTMPLLGWNVALPFRSGVHEIDLGSITFTDAQNTLAADVDVTSENSVAFRSTPQNDIVLSGNDNHVLGAFVGERASLMQLGIIASPLGSAPLDYMQPLPRDAWFVESAGRQTTIFRIDVDAQGIVRKVTIVVPSSDAAFDTSTQLRFEDATFRPATIDKRPVSGSTFVQVRH